MGEVCHFRVGGICMLTAGRGVGRVGVIQKLEKHPGAFDIVHIKDSKDHTFATRKELSKGKVIPEATMKLRKQTREKKRLLKILREQERKQMRNKPKKKAAKKAAK